MRTLGTAACCCSSVGHAETPQQIRQIYTTEAAPSKPAFTPSAKRGETLFRQRFAINDKMPACTSCHTDSPLNAGQHAVTGKASQAAGRRRQCRALQPIRPRWRNGSAATARKWSAAPARRLKRPISSPYMSEVR